MPVADGPYRGRRATFEITTNRRSRPQIIEVANQFALTIPERIEKTMAPHRPASGGAGPEIVAWSASTEAGEAGWAANLILDLADQGSVTGTSPC